MIGSWADCHLHLVSFNTVGFSIDYVCLPHESPCIGVKNALIGSTSSQNYVAIIIIIGSYHYYLALIIIHVAEFNSYICSIPKKKT